MPRKLAPADRQTLYLIEDALGAMRVALTHLRAARCPRSAQRLHAAIRSTEGAMRHAHRRVTQE